MFDVNKIRADFPMLSSEKTMQGHPLVFLDNASTTFKPEPVIQAMNVYYRDETSNSHRGDYDLCYNADQHIERARKSIASFLHAEPNEVVFTAGTTDSLNLVAYGYGLKHLRPGDEILLSLSEHASNLLPWFRIADLTGAKITYVPLENHRVTLDGVKRALTKRTKIVSLAYVGNVLGYRIPAKEIAKAVHDAGAILVLDGAQAVPHIAIDVKELDCDFLAFSGHKMCGPTGIGVLYGKYEVLKDTDPLQTGGGMNVKFFPSGEALYLDPPMRFEAGTLNLAGIYGLEAAVNYLQAIGMGNIETHEKALKKYAVAKLQETGMVEIYNPDSEAGIVTFNIHGVFAQDAATLLNSKGIACRSGQHCAKILPEDLGTVATVRASFYLYTTQEEIDALVEAVKQGGNFLDAYF